MFRLLRPMVLLLLAAATAVLPAFPLDLLLCRCTGTLTTTAASVDCCGLPIQAVPSCCDPTALDPAAPVANTGSADAPGCMLAFHVQGSGDPLSATPAAARTADGSEAPPALAVPLAPFRLPATAFAGASASAGCAPPALPAPPAAHPRI